MAHVGGEKIDFSNFVYPEDLEDCLDKWATLLSSRVNVTYVTFELRWMTAVKPDGDDFQWTLATCCSMLDENGNVASIYGCITDINDKKRAERETKMKIEALERAKTSEHRFHTYVLV